ncbi:hypothetical protein VTN77DRAFT_7830 [Rasamsonia byssochlamydoides]|uniref:uncharacterized protein n=1 Tax=Rasamsonia byssochlamydoides TaxID=89139 RepID=UPI003743787F
MSQDRQVPPGFGAGSRRKEEGGGGSVRRARELLEAGARRESPGQSQYADNIQPPGLQPRGKPPKGIGVAISNPVPMAQWQQRDEGKPAAPSNSFTPRGPPPLRPKRPSNVPSILDSSKIQDITPSIPYRPQNNPATSPSQARQPLPSSGERDSYVSPTSMVGKDYRESAGSEALTDISEDLPAKPTSQAPTAARRSANLGPPPASRRGPSSYYSRGTFVSPIPEELSDHTPRKESFASSAVIPLSWGSGVPESDILGDYDAGSISDSDDDSRRSDRSDNDEEETTLVRQASLGKRGRPSLRTINKPEQASPRATEEIGLAVTVDGKSGGATSASKLDQRKDSSDGDLGQSTLDLDGRTSSDSDSSRSSGSSDSSGFFLEKAPIGLDKPPTKAPQQGDRDASGAERKVGGIATPAPGMSDKIPESRRPPRLNVDAVREAEARGSLTSLTDLIRRATTLASNLERGRTASRLGFLDMFTASREPNREPKAQSSGEGRSSGSISDLLASFPPPRNDTPNTEQQPPPWPHGPPEKFKARDLQSRETTTRSPATTPSNPRRRCCGMPLGVFVLLCVIGILFVAAAVIVPVVLFVIPRINKHTVSASSSNATDTNPCQQSLPCMNGGVSVLNHGACACVCVNGFSGSQCTIAGDASCTTTEIGDGSSIDRNVTVGSALPRLFSEAQANFSIPLNETEILSLFSANNMSCTTQNALVSFSGISEKRRRLSPSDSGLSSAISKRPQTTPAAVFLGARGDGSNSYPPVATSNGILFEPEATASTTSTPTSSASGTISTVMMMGGGQLGKTTSTSQSTPTSTPSPSSSSASSSESASSLTPRILDFARIAILFVFEQTDNLDAATTAQSGIESFLTDMPATSTQNSSSDMNMNMNVTGSTPTEFVLNFANFTITLANGTVVGGGGSIR